MSCFETVEAHRNYLILFVFKNNYNMTSYLLEYTKTFIFSFSIFFMFLILLFKNSTQWFTLRIFTHIRFSFEVLFAVIAILFISCSMLHWFLLILFAVIIYTKDTFRLGLSSEKLIPLWFELRMLTNFYISYKKYTSILCLIIFSISFLCWCCICFSFCDDFTFLSFPWLFVLKKEKHPKVFTYIFNNKDFFITHMDKFYLIFNIIPRYILLITFLVEIIYFKHPEYIYILILILPILIFCNSFFIYNIKRFKKECELEFEVLLDKITTTYIYGYDDEGNIDPVMTIPYKDFIKIYVQRYMRDKHCYPFDFSYNIIIYKYFKTYIDEKQLSNKFQKYLDASILIAHYKLTASKYYVFEIFILFGYFLIWGSLLILNIH